MDPRSAELTKYAANAMLASRISFMNELARIAEVFGADIESIRRGVGSDSRIGRAFIYAGAGYGGSCFPKDVKALIHAATERGIKPRLLSAVEAVNAVQKTILFSRVSEVLGEKINGSRVAIWGLAFKPNTDDIREAPALVLLEALSESGATVQAYDPVAMPDVAAKYKKMIEAGRLTLVQSAMAALEGADLLVVVTEWQEFRSPDFDKMHELLKSPVIIDGRNVYDPEELAERGFAYYGIGRGLSVSRKQ